MQMVEYVTIQDAAKSLNVHEQTVRNWIREKRLTGYTKPGFGRQVFVKRAELSKMKDFKPK